MDATRKSTVLAAIALAAPLGLAACGEGGLRTLENPSPGPDEFLIETAQPLSRPDSFAELPPPAPGGPNRAKRNTREEAVMALGGSLVPLDADGEPVSEPARPAVVPWRDRALVAAASRYGVPEDIREIVEREFRAEIENPGLRGLAASDRYNALFSDERLDQRSEADRFRRAGVFVSSAPPGR